jgi:hypothetical protein
MKAQKPSYRFDLMDFFCLVAIVAVVLAGMYVTQ